MKLFFLTLILLAAGVLPGANLLKNGSFETPHADPRIGKTWNPRIIADWSVSLNSGWRKVSGEWCDDAFDGKKSMKLTSHQKKVFASIGQEVECKPDSELTASMYIKSPTNAKGYFRVYFIGPDGQKRKKYLFGGKPATQEWSRYEYRFRVPSDVKRLRLTVEFISRTTNSSLFVDKVELTENAGPVLKNDLLRAEINPLVGGVIDQLVLKTPAGTENFACKRTLNSSGGLAVDVIPSGKLPGLFANRNFKLKVLEPDRKIRVTGENNDLRLEKTFTLDPVAPRITVECALTNNGTAPYQTTWRVQNVLPARDGFYTAPTKDWLQSVHRDKEAIKTMTSVKVNNFMGNWLAKSTPQAAFTAVFPRGEVDRGYHYLAEKIDTVEWYFNPFRLAPGETKRFTYTLTAVPAGSPVVSADNKTVYQVNDLKTPAKGSVYDGKTFKHKNISKDGFDVPPGVVFGSRYKAQFIRGIKLPPPPPASAVPNRLKGFFMYTGSDPALTWKESSGTSKDQDFVTAARRSFRDAAKNYLNHIRLGRLSYPGAFAPGNLPGGRNVIGELGRRYNLHYSVGVMAFDKHHVDVEKSAADIQKRIKNKFAPGTIELIKKYSDLFLYVCTADEPSGQNIPAMLYTHEQLSKIVPDLLLFPVVNVHQFVFIPYVSVFNGDWYPISRVSGRKPWSVETITSEAVRRCGNVPFFVVLQAFGHNGGVYGLPTPGEARLMITLAAACGAKAISFHETVNRGMPWRTNYGYAYTFYGNAGDIHPGWEVIGECGKWLSGIGPLLTEQSPDTKFKGVAVECNEYRSSNGFYVGPEVKSYVLGGPRGRVIFAVNQNVDKNVSATVRFKIPAGEKLYCLKSCKQVSAEQKVDLTPGGSAIWYLGKDSSVMPEIEKNFFERGSLVLGIDAERAAKNKVDLSEYYRLAKGAKTIKQLQLMEQAYTKAFRNSPFGKFSARWDNARSRLSKVTFEFVRHQDLVIPPELRKKAPRYKRWKNTADPVMQKLVDSIADDFRNYWRIDAAIEEGKWQLNAAEAEKLINKISADTKAALDHLKANSHKIKVDNPY